MGQTPALFQYKATIIFRDIYQDKMVKGLILITYQIYNPEEIKDRVKQYLSSQEIREVREIISSYIIKIPSI